MEHEEAIRSQAAERYAARELPPAERDAFESHFFDCAECAEEVRWELAFKANARAALQARETAPHPAVWERWLAWLHPRRALTFSLAGNACLILGCLVLLASNRHWTGPQVVPAFFAPGPTRSAETQMRLIPPGVPAFIARLPAAPGLERVSVQILDETGKRASAGTVAPNASQDGEWFLEVPVKGLPDAAYTLVVSAENQVLTRFRFRTSRRRTD